MTVSCCCQVSLSSTGLPGLAAALGSMSVSPEPPSPQEEEDEDEDEKERVVSVNVECRLKPSSTEHFGTVGLRVERFLRAFLADVRPHTDVRPGREDATAPEPSAAAELWASLAESVCNVRICEVDGLDTESNALRSYPASRAAFKVHVYQPAEEGAVEETSEEEEEENILMANHWVLPSADLEGLWENLIFEGDVQLRLLNYVATMMLFSDLRVDPNIIALNRVILLHGPPGTGKTSLCRALAQKLSIRLGNRYLYGKLVEINSHSLFSKWFSESGKFVQKMFSRIHDLAADEDALVCVLIDEVESLAAARASATSGSDPSDAMRVVNALLTQIDQLKRQKNVLILATSNITQAIDVAFVDRADIKQYIGLPSTRVAFVILGSCIQELIRVGIIIDGPLVFTWPDARRQSEYDDADARRQSEYDDADAHLRLRKISRSCGEAGFSGRNLRKLPFLAHASHLRSRASSLNDFMDALERTIQDERRGAKRLK